MRLTKRNNTEGPQILSGNLFYIYRQHINVPRCSTPMTLGGGWDPLSDEPMCEPPPSLWICHSFLRYLKSDYAQTPSLLLERCHSFYRLWVLKGSLSLILIGTLGLYLWYFILMDAYDPVVFSHHDLGNCCWLLLTVVVAVESNMGHSVKCVFNYDHIIIPNVDQFLF